MAVLNAVITADADDGYQDGVNWYSDYVYIGHWANDEQPGLRFLNITIPQGATISSAILQLRGTGMSGTIGNIHMRVWADDVDNAAAWSGSSKPTDVAKTGSSFDWNPSSWSTSAYNTVGDIKALIQGIVNRAGWASGNAIRIAILNNGTTGNNEAEASDYPTNPAKLDITYTTGGGGTTYPQTLTETITLTDALSRKDSKPFAETVTFTDSLPRRLQRALSDTVTLTDSLLRGTTKLAQETITLTDTAARAVGKALSEAVTFTDTLPRNLARAFSETVTLTDALANVKSFLKTLTETITFSDSLSRATSKAWAETVTLSDSAVKAISRAFAETVTLTDSLTNLKSRIQVFLETITLSDSLSRATGRVFTETVTLTGAVSKAISRAFSETVSFLDSFTGSGWNPSTSPQRVFRSWTAGVADMIRRATGGASDLYRGSSGGAGRIYK